MRSMKRFLFTLSLASCLFSWTLQSSSGQSAEAIRWQNLSDWRVEGKGWTDTKHPYDRLPARAEKLVRPAVWQLAQDSAGMRYRFVTDAKQIRARWKVRRTNLALPHMPATGVSGLDLYVHAKGKWHWLANGRPEKPGMNEVTLVSGLGGQKTEYSLYLPLYNGIDSVEIGVAEGALLEKPADRYSGKKPVVFYGTSILQGGCASRPGMAYPSIVGRTLEWPTINLGFSGNGKSEPEVAALLAELDPAVYVLDSLPNLSAQEAEERIAPFVEAVRKVHPKTPIVLVENVRYADADFVASRGERVRAVNAVLKKVYSKRKKEGDLALFYVPSDRLLGNDGEATVDGVHPTDLGFLRMAEGITPVVKQALRHAGTQ
jgi:lysophospholipase L1-like esterase